VITYGSGKNFCPPNPPYDDNLTREALHQGFTRKHSTNSYATPSKKAGGIGRADCRKDRKQKSLH
jgi:hypothetical protein